MPSFKDDLQKKQDYRDTLAVYGYCKNHYKDVPDDIKAICIQYLLAEVADGFEFFADSASFALVKFSSKRIKIRPALADMYGPHVFPFKLKYHPDQQIAWNFRIHHGGLVGEEIKFNVMNPNPDLWFKAVLFGHTVNLRSAMIHTDSSFCDVRIETDMQAQLVTFKIDTMVFKKRIPISSEFTLQISVLSLSRRNPITVELLDKDPMKIFDID